MKCPHLQGNDQPVCKAQGGVYSPSAEELEEYCTNSAYELCISFCMKEIDEVSR